MIHFESFFWLDRIEPQLKLSIDKERLDTMGKNKIESLMFKKKAKEESNSNVTNFNTGEEMYEG